MPRWRRNDAGAVNRDGNHGGGEAGGNVRRPGGTGRHKSCGAAAARDARRERGHGYGAAGTRTGTPRRFVLGHHPAMGISEAREAAGAMRSKVQQEGADPIAEKRRKHADARAAAAGIGTLAALLDLYGAKAGAGQKSWPDCRRRIGHVFAVVHGQTAGDAEGRGTATGGRRAPLAAVCRCGSALRPAGSQMGCPAALRER